jgi:hypothetical protein
VPTVVPRTGDPVPAEVCSKWTFPFSTYASSLMFVLQFGSSHLYIHWTG